MAMSGYKMENLQEELFIAIQRADASRVTELRKLGASCNKIGKSGFTALGLAAQCGNLGVVKLLLEQLSQNDEATECSNVPSTQKQGYFVYVHCDENENEATSHQPQAPHVDVDPKTPDGMERLEWDMEVCSSGEQEAGTGAEEDGEAQGGAEDSWVSLYRWYASILERTGHAMLMISPPSSPGKDGTFLEKIDVNCRDYYCRTAVHYAAEQGHDDILNALLDAGCKPDVGDSSDVRPLLLASARGHVRSVSILLARGAQSEARGPDKSSPLHAACARGLSDVAITLLDAGARIDAMDSSDRTPLFLAVSRGHEKTAEMLIQRGARVNLEEIHGYTPLCEAVWQKRPRLVRLLLSAGSKLTHSHRLLHHCVLLRQLEVVRLLLGAGALANLRDDSGDTPLLLAVRTGQVDMVELLVENGASVNFSNSVTGHSVLHEAVSHDFITFLRLLRCLVCQGVDLDAEALAAGDTPLCRALLLGRGRAAAALIRRGARVNMHVPIAGDVVRWAYQKTGCFNLLQTLVLAGHTRVNPSSVPRQDNDVVSWLKYISTNPLSLRELSRLVVRQSMGQQVYQLIEKCNLPKPIKSYVRMQDICDSESDED